jgi:hypothetical protein
VKYIYDILLNLNEIKAYEFYEWNSDDDIEYFKRVPLFRVDDETYNKLEIENIIEDDKFLEKIYNTTEIYDNKMVRRVEYICIFTNGKEAKAIFLNRMGKILMVSKMLVDEEEEATDIGDSLEEIQLSIISMIKDRQDDDQYLTRLEKKKMYFLNKEIEELYTGKKIIKLKYLYYECSHNIEDNIDMLYNKIKEFINSEWSAKHDELYDLVRLSYSKK